MVAIATIYLQDLWRRGNGPATGVFSMNSSNKIVLFGDSGVGKSTLCAALCGNLNSRPQSTIGCVIQIMVHQYAAGTQQESMEFIELWDVGGSSVHRETSAVFLDNVAGMILVHDLTNARSGKNLAQWTDLFHRVWGQKSSASLMNRLSPSDSQTSFCDLEHVGSVPTLVVGSHADMVSSRGRDQTRQLQPPFLKKYDCIYLDCRKEISAGSTTKVVLSKFFDAVVDKSRTGAEDKAAFGSARRRKFI